ncbi:hypothetical protein [Dyadobacter sediminis]|uniref:Uncharacterized protein n=1 Tax=Dyadobacter sediminis TaxID=1493691 RepID=A0A5R9K760_9BACT|nr:hypothetical protein [Dyadobacter sediminis]TLU89617.1 hypothetical protein FEM55_23060 [Dyadobacter sediminis]GGC03800.1 hypothetical protein GCM10011325_33490 [Dyadobacter sediminis]
MADSNKPIGKYSTLKRFGETFLAMKGDDIPLVPYFKYDIVDQLNEFHLVFSSEPSTTFYENTIFSKLVRLATFSQSLRCFRYHFEAYPDKIEFLDFFSNEIPIRLTKSYSVQEKTILEGLLAEVNRQLEENTVTPKCEEEVDIYTLIPKPKLIALMKIIFYGTKEDSPFDANQEDIVALLRNFTPFKKGKRSTLVRKVTENIPEDYLPEPLIVELKKFLTNKS